MSKENLGHLQPAVLDNIGNLLKGMEIVCLRIETEDMRTYDEIYQYLIGDGYSEDEASRLANHILNRDHRLD